MFDATCCTKYNKSDPSELRCASYRPLQIDDVDIPIFVYLLPSQDHLLRLLRAELSYPTALLDFGSSTYEFFGLRPEAGCEVAKTSKEADGISDNQNLTECCVSSMIQLPEY